MTRRRGGFTLIELLAVVVILAILASLAAVASSIAITNSRISKTEGFLKSLAFACDAYAGRWGDFPPSTIDDLGGRAPNPTNNGIEALVACLASEKKGPRLLAADGVHYVNTDDDAATEEFRKSMGWFFGDAKLREVTDEFGFVVTYLQRRDFDKPRPGLLPYRFSADGAVLPIAPEHDPSTNAWVGAGRFQLRSVGPDGLPGTSDDIRAGH